MLSGMGDSLGHNQTSKSRGLYESPFLQGMSFDGPSVNQSSVQGMGSAHFVSKMDMIPPPPSHAIHDHDFVNMQPPPMSMSKSAAAAADNSNHETNGMKKSSSSGGKKRARSASGSMENKKERKNNREKQRRSELNTQFESLMSLCGLDPKNKPEKYAILAESSTLIRKLISENHLLKTEKMELESELGRMNSYIQKSYPGQSPRSGFQQYSSLPPKSNQSSQRPTPPNEELDIFQ